MATIPQVTDFGSRPSLRSSRVDVPGSGEMALANSLANAADTFAKVMVERQDKKDAIEYANNKSLLLTEDIRLRELFKDDQDYDTFGERYRTGMKTFRETLTFRSTHDSAIFDADANLITERGAVAVGEIGRKLRIDKENADLLRNLDQSERDIAGADPMTRNDHLMNALEGITAAEEAGNLLEVPAEKMRQDFATRVAIAELVFMDPVDREEALKISIAKNPSREDIKAGKGTGSLADFLHQDEKIEMLRKAQLENKVTRDRQKGFAVADEAFELYPLATQGKERQQYVRENAPDVDSRAVAQSSVTSRNTDMFRADQQMRLGVMRGAATMIDEGASYNDIPESELARLSAGERNTLKDYYQQHLDEQEFAERTNWNEWGRWKEMSVLQKMDEDLTSPFWKTTVDGPTWRAMMEEQKVLRKSVETATPPPLDTGLNNMQMLDAAAAGTIYPATGRSDTEEALRNALRFSFDTLVTDKSAVLNKKLTNQERKQELAEMLMDSAFVDRDLIMSDYDPDEAVLFAGMTPSQRKKAYLPLTDAAKEFYTDPEFGVITVEKLLRNMASTAGLDPSDDNIERAYYALKAGLGDPAIMDRLAGLSADEPRSLSARTLLPGTK